MSDYANADFILTPWERLDTDVHSMLENLVETMNVLDDGGVVNRERLAEFIADVRAEMDRLERGPEPHLRLVAS